MGKMTIDVSLIKDLHGDDTIDFQINGNSFPINLNSDKQEGLKPLFYRLIEVAINNELVFEVKYDEKVYSSGSYLVEMCNEYVEQLKSEIETIQKDYEESGLKENDNNEQNN